MIQENCLPAGNPAEDMEQAEKAIDEYALYRIRAAAHHLICHSPVPFQPFCVYAHTELRLNTNLLWSWYNGQSNQPNYAASVP